MILGVYKQDLGELFAKTLVLMNVKRAWVVHGLLDGLDEIAPSGITLIWEVFDGKINSFQISPKDFGLDSHSLDSVKGGKEENTKNMLDLLQGRIITGPLIDFVLLNSAALLYICGKCSNLKSGVEMSKESLRSGEAWKSFSQFKSFTVSF